MRTLFAVVIRLGEALIELIQRQLRRRRAAREGGRMIRDRGGPHHAFNTTARASDIDRGEDLDTPDPARVATRPEPSAQSPEVSTALAVRRSVRSRQRLREAVVLAEILDRPLALRPPRL